jgi:hypothetical protein
MISYLSFMLSVRRLSSGEARRDDEGILNFRGQRRKLEYLTDRLQFRLISLQENPINRTALER